MLLSVCFSILSLVAVADGPGFNQDLVDKFEWRQIGPASMGGRVSDIAVVEKTPWVFYAGLGTGGVLKTTNNGTSWTAVFDDQPVQSIGAVAVCQSKPDLVWVGTGEANARNSSGWGNGVYKSTDAGKTWTNMGLKETQTIERIVIDPQNPDTVYVAAMGRLWGTNPERGLYKTTDGGKTWNQILKVDDRTGCIDVALGTGGTVYAAMWERLRTAYSFQGTGPGSGLYRSTDSGATWTKLTNGIPPPPLGRIGISVSKSNPKVVVAVIDSQRGGGGQVSSERSKDGGVFRTEDGGESWSRVNPTVPRGFYFGQIRLDPQDDKKVFLLGTGASTSTDGGKTFRAGYARNVHADIHAFWVDPTNGEHAILGCDGGVYQTYDGGRNWDHVNNFPMAQFYDITADMRQPFHVYGGLQDNGSWGAPSASRTTLGVNNADWYSINSNGDGFYACVDQRDPNIVYAESQNGGVTRLDRGTGQTRSIGISAPEGQPEYRFNWNTPLHLSYHNQDILFVGANRLVRVWEKGTMYEAISPDLSKMIGARINTAGSGAENHGTIVAIGESPVKEGVIWCGTDDGNVQVTRDGGKTWKNVTGKLPGDMQDLWIAEIECSRHDAGTAYVAIDGHRSDDFQPHLFMTTNYGDSWKSVSGNLPKDHPIQNVRESPLAPGVLVAATYFGVFLSNDTGKTWVKASKGMPSVEVDGLYIHPRDLAICAATHGRSVYILDNAAPLLQCTPEALKEDVYLFQPPPGNFYNLVPGADLSNREFTARNPTRGLTIYYWLKEEPKSKPKLTISGPDGKTVYETEGGTFTGLSSITWDMRAEQQGDQPAGGGRRFGGGGTIPFAAPGKYKVTLKLGDKTLTREFDLTGDAALTKREDL